jgi:hypothetical protein
MAKIPVGPTIGAAYGFLFSQIGTVIGIAGIPAVLYAGADYAGHAFNAAYREELNVEDPETLGSGLILTLAVILVMLLAMSLSAVGVTRAVLVPGAKSAPGWLPLDLTTWRMFAANLRFLLGAIVLIVLAMVLALVAYRLAGIPLDAPEQAVPTFAVGLAALVSWAVILYAIVSLLRIGFLLPPAVIAEKDAGLRRSHALTQGNVWRVIAIVLALGLPIFFLVLAAATAILSSALGPDFAGQALTPELMQRIQQAIEQRLLAWETFNAVIFVLYSGLIYSGAAYAYQAAMGRGD